MSIEKLKFMMFCVLLVPIVLIATALWQLTNGHASVLVYFNIILNSVFGIVNLIGILR